MQQNNFDNNAQIMQQMQTLLNSGQKRDVKKLTIVHRQKIYVAYMKMYQGLVVTNWTHGKTLGQSMYQGMEQIKSFIETKKSDNIAITYLRQVQASHNVIESKQMMTNPKRNAKINVSNQKRQEYARVAAAQTRDAMAEINSVLAQFKEHGQQNAQQKQAAKTMQPMMSENGTMTYSARAANAKNSQKAVNPTKTAMESDAERQARHAMHVNNPREIVAPENGSMMRSEKSAGNRTSARTPNPGKKYMPVEKPRIEKDAKQGTKIDKFKNGMARLTEMNAAKKSEMHPQQAKKLSLEQLMRLRMRQNGKMAA